MFTQPQCIRFTKSFSPHSLNQRRNLFYFCVVFLYSHSDHFLSRQLAYSKTRQDLIEVNRAISPLELYNDLIEVHRAIGPLTTQLQERSTSHRFSPCISMHHIFLATLPKLSSFLLGIRFVVVFIKPDCWDF
jgi:hypothetical protein